jgi:hypothetical protein
MNFVILAKGNSHVRSLIDSSRQHKAIVVVGMFTDYVDPTGGPDHQWVALEGF